MKFQLLFPWSDRMHWILGYQLSADAFISQTIRQVGHFNFYYNFSKLWRCRVFFFMGNVNVFFVAIAWCWCMPEVTLMLTHWSYCRLELSHRYPDSKVHGANMGPTWVLSAPDGPNVGRMNLAIWVCSQCHGCWCFGGGIRGQGYQRSWLVQVPPECSWFSTRWAKPWQWASYQIREIMGCACAGNTGNVFSATIFKGNR